MENSTATSFTELNTTTSGPRAVSGAQLEYFCNTPFWDASLSWHTQTPDITPCFQFVIVRLLPCYLFWLLAPFKLLRYRSDRTWWKKEGKVACKFAYSHLTIAKLTACGVLTIVSLGELVQSVSLYATQAQFRPTSQFLSPAFELVTVVWVAIMIRYERRHGYVASGVLWFYWLLACACYVVVGYSAVLNHIRLTSAAPIVQTSVINGTASVLPSANNTLWNPSNEASRWNVDMCLLIFALVRLATNLVVLGLTCFADHEVDPAVVESDTMAQEFGNRETPEMAAGFLCRLTFAWMFSIVRRGARKSLEAPDLCSLNPSDRSDANTPRFEYVYNQAIAAWRIKQRELENLTAANGGAKKSTPVKRTSLQGSPKATETNKRSRLDGKTEPTADENVDANENPRLALVMHDDENGAQERTGKLVLNTKESDTDAVNVNGEELAQDDVRTPLHNESTGKRYAVAADSPTRSGRKRLFARRSKAKDGEEKEKDKDIAKKQKSEFELDPIQYPSALRSLLVVYWRDMARGYLCKALQDVSLFINAGLVGLLINFADDPGRFNYAWRGALFAVGLAANCMMQSISFQHTFHIGMRCGMRMRTALTTALYRKALTVSNSARAKANLGELVNLMAVDAQRLQDFIGFSWALWSCPEQIIVACVLIWTQMGVATLAGLATMFLVVLPVNMVVAIRQRKLQGVQMRYKDERLKLVNELLAGMRLVKLYAWEVPFRRRVSGTRDNEITVLRRAAYLGIVQSFIFTFAPYLVTVVTFAVFVASSEQELTAARAFVTLNLFQILRFPMGILPMIIQMAVTSLVSVKRISRFLAQPDLNEGNVTHEPNEAEPIVMENATFSWKTKEQLEAKNEQPVLHDVSLRVKRGELFAIVGRVGAGKSTLISAMLGETELHSGRVNVSGNLAYVAQQSWIQNASLRDNVLFGAQYDEDKYRRVVAACALETDLKMLPGGDNTEIGEKGINLSGGQKQRVALARALYADAEIYLFDDPLSAVDVHVGRHIFDHVVGPNGLLRDKTRVFVTHGLHWLRGCDRVAVIDHESRRIVQLGPYDQLIAEPDSFLMNNLHLESDRDAAAEESATEEATDIVPPTIGASNDDVSTPHRKRNDTERSNRSNSRNKDESMPTSPSKRPGLETQKSMTREQEEEAIRAAIKKQEEQKLIQEEKNATGRVKWSVYMMYFRAQSIVLFSVFAVVQACVHAFFICSSWWVSRWTEDPRLVGSQSNCTDNAFNTTLFPTTTPLTLLQTSQSTVTQPFTNDTCLTKGERDALRGYYLLIYGVIGIAMAIVALAASVLNAVGTVRASRVLHAAMLECILHVPMRFFDTTPTGRIVNRFSKDIDTVDNALPFTFRSWMQTVFGVLFTIIGICVGTPLALAMVIPAVALFYVVQRFFIPTSRQLKRLESTSKSPVITHFSESLQGRATIRAFNARERFVLESEHRTDRNNVYCFLGLVANRWIGIFLDFISTLFVAGAAAFCVGASLNMSTTGGRVGLSLTFALTIAQTLNWMVRMNNELETNIVSVERIQEYAKLEREAEWERSEAELRQDKVDLTSEWPTQGEIQFDAYATRYREHLDLVLRDISVTVRPTEKVGIVGRTGAGKSSFTLALFRMIEAANGRIVIDGIDIAKLGVHQLRGKLTILPQDPVIFAGTLRTNLDPFGTYTDDQIWHALELAGLKGHFAEGSGLAYECSEGGSNLSVGQRQLVCLARALLRKTKVLILDEATAAVDLRTDELIQRTIRTAFADCTVITIAHRLNTVMDYDRILVLDRGTVVEYDAPNTLINRPNSVFADMVRQSNSLK